MILFSTPAYRTSAWISLFMTPGDKPALEDLKTPTRILVGERDTILPVEMTRAIYDWLTCEKDLIVLPSAGHMLPVEYLGQTAPLVAEWLKTHLLAPSAPAAQETSAAAKADAVPAAPRKRAPRQAKKSEGASS